MDGGKGCDEVGVLNYDCGELDVEMCGEDHQRRARSLHVCARFCDDAAWTVVRVMCDTSHMMRFCMNLNMLNPYVESTSMIECSSYIMGGQHTNP